jgi:hypothetical protein
VDSEREPIDGCITSLPSHRKRKGLKEIDFLKVSTRWKEGEAAPTFLSVGDLFIKESLSDVLIVTHPISI